MNSKKRTFNIQNNNWSYPDGSGVQIIDWKSFRKGYRFAKEEGRLELNELCERTDHQLDYSNSRIAILPDGSKKRLSSCTCSKNEEKP